MLETELSIKIPEGKNVLIHYFQKAPNCIFGEMDFKSASNVTESIIQHSNELCSETSTIDFFVYTSDAYHKSIYEKRKNFIEDSGFFGNVIFTLHQNCGGFFIINPDGEFLKYYGEDYYNQVREFFERNE